MEWLCAPRPDSPSVFGAILDRGAGHFRISPYGVTVPAARRYLPGSMILETTWQTHTGWMIVRDTLVMGPWHDIETTVAHASPDPDGLGCRAHAAAYRAMRQRDRRTGDGLRAVVRLQPHPARMGVLGRGLRGGGRARKRDPDAFPTLRLTTNLRIGWTGRQARARTRLKEGEDVFVALSFSSNAAPKTYAEAADKMWSTSECWRQWINVGNFPDHPWRSYLQRSALTLKGLSYAPTGRHAGREYHVAAGNPSGRT